MCVSVSAGPVKGFVRRCFDLPGISKAQIGVEMKGSRTGTEIGRPCLL
ncbi:predicted protein [Plenodomus lingam JN3]|uniref:Predicted protein n=1 Tax=Leptosphaeria maculans (strain JN3 / isolate v23.1.3 / race Av1-4-5-6-7-8) TaxID=985895 RepID=E4ZHH7_LEPMJ|nr:predicted protein [Plenodomus lingam JN3]CBX90810.1 predicted protein [Plenodomus lingam JN3]